MRRRLLVLWIGLMVFTSAQADSREEVKGLWASDGSIFEVSERDGMLHGEIIALRDAVYSETEDPTRVGEARLDDNNPEVSLQARTIVGLEMFEKYVFDDDQWQGKIYDPESGNTYQSKMKLEDGLLEIRGYIGFPMFGRTAQFQPASLCTDTIVEMLQTTARTGVCAAR